MHEKTVSYDLDGQTVTITVTRATAYTGVKRSMLSYDGMKNSPKTDDDAMRVLRTLTYPDLVAPVKEAIGIPWPISFDEFIALPDDLVVLWESAVYEVNPHWSPMGQVEKAETEKKAKRSTTG
jgi:hypothetical protein